MKAVPEFEDNFYIIRWFTFVVRKFLNMHDLLLKTNKYEHSSVWNVEHFPYCLIFLSYHSTTHLSEQLCIVFERVNDCKNRILRDLAQIKKQLVWKTKCFTTKLSI